MINQYQFYVLAIIFCIIIVMAANPLPEQLYCTMDAKICPDGTGVGRDPGNNCEFFPCPTVDRCSLVPDAGSCEAAIPRYYFSDRECRMFLWGGCAGVVPFETLAECQATCL